MHKIEATINGIDYPDGTLRWPVTTPFFTKKGVLWKPRMQLIFKERLELTVEVARNITRCFDRDLACPSPTTLAQHAHPFTGKRNGKLAGLLQPLISNRGRRHGQRMTFAEEAIPLSKSRKAAAPSCKARTSSQARLPNTPL